MGFDVFFPAAIGQFTVQNDGSGILTVVPIALFVSEAVKFTSSLGHSLLLKVSMKERPGLSANVGNIYPAAADLLFL